MTMIEYDRPVSKLRRFLIAVLLVVGFRESSGAAESNVELFQYLSPVPGSSLVSPDNNIIIRPGGFLDVGSIRNDLVMVAGTHSGPHPGQLQLSDDLQTLIFLPDAPFAPGERVNVTMKEGLRESSGKDVPTVSFDFAIRSRGVPETRVNHFEDFVRKEAPVSGAQGESYRDSSPPEIHESACDILPASYPLISIDLVDDPEPGVLFISPFPSTFDQGNLVILDNTGVPLFYRKLPLISFDFKPQVDGTLTYFGSSSTGERKYYALDSSYAIVDSFACGNGYSTDGHELIVLENGHSLLMSYDEQIINMDSLIAGGDTAATVVGLIIQELDVSKNVVFQWRSWDHISILDGAVSEEVDLDSSYIDYIHGNAIELDDDGNIMISSRHINEITKIDRQSGDIIWRFGLNALNNDFMFINDNRGFSHQHDIRRLENGNVTLFDNGNFLDPEYSRALEYELDEQNLTATLVWEYRDDPDIYGAFMGSVGRFESGGNLICWGGTFGAASVTELHSDGSKAMELSYMDVSWSYRAFRSSWTTNLFTVSPNSVNFGTVAVGDSSIQSVTVSNNSENDLNINCFANSDSSFTVLSDPEIVIPPNNSVELSVRFLPGSEGDYLDYLYVRSVNDSELVAQSVLLEGTTFPTSVDEDEGIPAEYSLHQNYPNPFNPATTIRYDIPRATNVRIALYNVLGQEVHVLVDEFKSAGSYTARWEGIEQPSGVYFYRLETADFRDSKKLLLIR